MPPGRQTHHGFPALPRLPNPHLTEKEDKLTAQKAKDTPRPSLVHINHATPANQGRRILPKYPTTTRRLQIDSTMTPSLEVPAGSQQHQRAPPSRSSVFAALRGKKNTPTPPLLQGLSALDHTVQANDAALLGCLPPAHHHSTTTHTARQGFHRLSLFQSPTGHPLISSCLARRCPQFSRVDHCSLRPRGLALNAEISCPPSPLPFWGSVWGARRAQIGSSGPYAAAIAIPCPGHGRQSNT